MNKNNYFSGGVNINTFQTQIKFEEGQTRSKKGYMYRHLGIIAVIVAMFAMNSESQSASVDVQEAWGRYSRVAESYGGAIADQLAAHAGFSGSSGDIATAEILPFRSIRITTGLGLSASVWDRTMGQTLSNISRETLEIPTVLPMGGAQFGVRMGLPGSGLTDIGVRIGGMARTRIKVGDGIKASIMNQTFGVSIRQKLFGNVSTGAVALGFGFSRSSGDIGLLRDHKEASLGTHKGSSGSYSTSFTGGTRQINSWAVNTWSTTIRISKKMKGFHPWLGVTRQWYKGEASSEFSGTGVLTLVDSDTEEKTDSKVTSKSLVVKPAKTGDTKFVAGFLKTFGPIAWTIQLESELKNKHALFIGIATGI